MMKWRGRLKGSAPFQIGDEEAWPQDVGVRMWWSLLIGLTGIFGIAISFGLGVRWEMRLADWKHLAGGEPELVKFVWNCAAAALIPAFLSCVVTALIFRKLKRPPRAVVAITAVAILAIGLLGGALPLGKLDRRNELIRREREAQGGLVAAGDPRMDSLALVAACAISKDRKVALEKVRPILSRGLGIGTSTPSPISSSTIRAYLEGSGPPPRETCFMRPPGL